MKRERLVWIVVMGALTASLILNGCGGSRPAKFYILNPVNAPGGAGKQAALSTVPAVTVGVGPVTIPDYLDRPSIVTRTSQNGLDVAQFDRWGGGLKADIERVLVENLSALLPADRVVVVSWKRGVALQHRLGVDVTRFDATPGESVWLKAHWALFDQDGKTVAVAREADIREPVGGRDYAAVVAAMSRALGKLSQEMANGITAVLSAKPKG